MSQTVLGRLLNATPATAKVAAAAGQSTIGLAVTRNWKAAMHSILEKLDTLHTRRAELVAQRRGLLLDAVDGGDNKDLARIERDIETVDREVRRLEDARAVAAELADVQAQADARASQVRALELWEAEATKLIELAERADDAAREAAGLFARLAEAVEKQAATCPVPLDGHPAERVLGAGRVTAALQMTMASNGAPWAWRGLLPWKDRPTAASTVADGLAWARHELQRRKPKAA